MKRDKRKKDVHRAHDQPNKSENKSNNASVSRSQVNSTKDQKGDVKPALGRDNVEEAKEVQPQINFANLKRETDEINQLNTKTYSKRQITSNWAKYETPLPPEEEEIISKGADFESLLGAPISEGGHFKFKSEQMWSQNPLQFSDIFSLDVNRLAKSLSRVPFYEQVSLSKELFSQEELETMDKEAAQNSDRYKTSLNEPVVDKFYEVLKLSLVESPVPKNADTKSDVPPKSIVKGPTENTRVMFSFADDQVDDIQPVKHLQLEDDLDPSPETQEIILRPKTVEKELSVNKSNVIPDVALSQRSHESELNDSIESKSLPAKEQVSNTVNILSKNTETEVPVPESVSNGNTSQTSDSALKKNPRTVEDDDELDFLLTLKQPVSGPKFAAKIPAKPKSTNDNLSDDLGALSLSSTTETKAELEDWLDSMLAD